MKSDWMDKRLRFNSSLFYYDYQDLQVQSFPGGGVLQIDNAGSAKVKGAEFELSYLPSASWQFDAGISYLDATYTEFDEAAEDIDGVAGVEVFDAAGNHLNSTPEWTADLTMRYFQPVSGGLLTYRLNYYWQDDEFFTPANNEFKGQSAYELINASLSFSTHDDRMEVTLYGDNLGNRDYFNSTFDFDPINGISGTIMPPRTYGVKVAFRFD